MCEINRILAEWDEEPIVELMAKGELAEFLSKSSAKEYIQNE